MGLKSRWKPKYLGKKLRQIREGLNLSQPEMLRHLGIDKKFRQQTISAFERGEMDPPLPVILLYARAAGISTDALIDDEQQLPKKFTAISIK